MSGTLLEFARANDGAAATSSKLRKQAVLAEYFRGLSEKDLRLAVRYAGGRTFAATDERVLSVGWSIVSYVVLELLNLDPRHYHDLVVRSGEIGEALSKVWPVGGPTPHASPSNGHEYIEWHAGKSTDESRAPRQLERLTLQDVAHGFDALARTGIVRVKRQILAELFARCVDPREAAYLAKIIFRELRSGVREGVLQAAIAQAFAKELSQIQKCQLLVGDLDEVAVLARSDALEAARFRLFHPIQFMLAAPQETAELAAEALGGRTFDAEDKLDGIRAQVHKSGGRVAIYTRTMDRADESFPEIVAQMAAISGEFLLDGEIVPFRDGQVLPFAHIQRRLGRKRVSQADRRENPVAFIAFDVLYLNGELLMDRPLHDRRRALDCLRQGADSVGSHLMTTAPRPVCSAAEIAGEFGAARGRRNEGIVLKDPDSAYAPGRRRQWWLKLKTHLPTFDCVVTAAEYGHGKRRGVLSDYTFAVWDRDPQLPGASLLNVGKAYSGLTDEEIAQLTELFLDLTVHQWGRVHGVTPRVVLEIACDQIQQSDRHASGYALRFPRIKRIRWDKRPQDADRLSRIVEIYQSTPNFARPAGKPTPCAPEPSLFGDG